MTRANTRKSGRAMNERFQLLINPFPILRRHFTIPLRQHTAQQIRPYYGDMLDFADQLNQMFVFYNGPLCGASAPDHMHFQAGPKEQLPTTCLSKHFEIRAKTKDEMIVRFQQVYDSLPIVSSEIEPRMNVLTWKDADEFVTIIIPRTKHRPDCYDAPEGERMMISPGALDMAGLIVTPRAEDFERITAEEAERIIKECGA